MTTPTILDLTTGRLPAVIVTGRENVGSRETVFGICTPDVSEDEIRAACGKTEITMSGFPSVTRTPTGLGGSGDHVQRFVVTGYSGD